MRRREFLWLLGYGAAASWISLAAAQQTSRVYHIAIVSNATPVSEMTETGNRRYRAFLKELRRLGYVEGRNLIVERYSGGGPLERYRGLVKQIVRSNPDVVLASTANLVADFKAHTTTIPIVAAIYDPVALGLVESLARPGGNITGATTPAIEIGGKRLGLLKEAVPRLSRVGLLVTPTLMGEHGTAMLKEASKKAGITLVGTAVEDPFGETAYRRAFATMVHEGAEAVMLLTRAKIWRTGA